MVGSSQNNTGDCSWTYTRQTHKHSRTSRSPSAGLSICVLTIFPLPQTPTEHPGSASPQGMDSGYGDSLPGECLRKPDWKQLKLYGVGDPVAMFSSDSSCLSSRGRVSKWFWDSAEEGYRTYHMDEYDEDKNPSVSKDPTPSGWEPRAN